VLRRHDFYRTPIAGAANGLHCNRGQSGNTR
jgi:hypothetical protein